MEDIQALVTRLTDGVTLYDTERHQLVEWLASFKTFTLAIRQQITAVEGQKVMVYFKNWFRCFLCIRDQFFLSLYGAVTKENQFLLHEDHLMDRVKPRFNDLDFNGWELLNLSSASNYGIVYLLKQIEGKPMPKVRQEYCRSHLFFTSLHRLSPVNMTQFLYHFLPMIACLEKSCTI